MRSALWRGAMDVVAAETGDASSIHEALDEVVRLHAVLFCRPFGKVREGRFAEMVLFQRPEVLQIEPDVKSDRPVVVLPGDAGS